MFRYSWIIFIIFHISSFAQGDEQIKQVGAGEYITVYRTNLGNVFITTRKNNKYIIKKIIKEKIIAVDGAQYTAMALDSAGAVYIIGISKEGEASSSLVAVDAKGNPFTGNSNVYGWFLSYLTLKNGKVFMWGEDLLNINEEKKIDAPVQLQTPGNKKIKKLVPITAGEPSILALATDGTVWIYSKKNKNPLQVKLNGAAVNIAGIGSACYVVATKNDLFAWGYLGSYLGLSDFSTTPVSIKKKWTVAGCTFPLKEIVGNYNTLHIIDANDNMFAAGENVQGEIGNGLQYPDWKNYPTSPFAWNWQHSQMLTKPVQIMGKFKNICTGNSIAFYHYVQDMNDNWYSWGRNKARSLGNGITLNIEDEAIYPDALIVPAPVLVTPLEIKWRIMEKIKPTYIPEPFAHAGINQYISTSATMLFGRGSSQQGGSIKKYKWIQISGAPAIILSPNKPDTKVTGLVSGSYIFELTVTNDKEMVASSSVVVQISNLAK